MEPDLALFASAVSLTQQCCDDKKEDKAFILCLPRKATPQNPPLTASSDPCNGMTIPECCQTQGLEQASSLARSPKSHLSSGLRCLLLRLQLKKTP